MLRYLDLTLPTPAENLACDEALLDWCERSREEGLLRFWMPEEYFVVIGYGNQIATEVNEKNCQDLGIPILRRCSGGGTVLQGPGCLNYALVLPIEEHFQGITETNCFIMKRHAEALTPLLDEPVSVGGHTDLIFKLRKFSGNAQRRRRRFLLFHGTFLLAIDPELMEQVLPAPSRQPDYRKNRSHAEFLTVLPLLPDRIKEALQTAWQASEPLKAWPEAAVAHLARTKYSNSDWHVKRTST